uniref:carbohydrate ABC transporter permease n=1 Tax=Candidatus Fimenecus sp. TaxID=3022888 RepID=UPI0040260078
MTAKSKTKAVHAGSKKFTYRYKWWAYGMMLPAFALLTIFVITPFVMAVYRSFTDYSAYNENIKFVWFDNYVTILSDVSFIKSLGNVVLMTVIYAVLMFVLSFLFALLLTKLTPQTANVAKVVTYLPFMLSGILLSVIFIFLFSQNGLFNALRMSHDADGISFATDGIWPYVIIILPLLWGGFGYNSLVMYAGLLNIPNAYYEAAEIDGANGWNKLWGITIPNMKNYFVLIIINLITGGLQMFELPLMMTSGGPLEKTLTPVLFIFWQKSNPSIPESAVVAGAILIMIPIAAINLIVFKLIRSEKSVDE